MDAFALIAAERQRLAEALDDLAPEEWSVRSLCGSWTTHEVAAHLDVPFVLSAPRFVLGLLRARGDFDRANARFATELAAAHDPAWCVATLREHATSRFTPPGHGPEAPLTDVVVHGGDILRPLDRGWTPAPEALAVALRFVTGPKAVRGFGALPVADVHLEATDADVSAGHGGVIVTGPARSLVGVVLRRPTYLDDLDGPGVELLRERLAAG